MCLWVEMDGPDVREVGTHPTPADIARYNQQSPGADRGRAGTFPTRAKGMARASLRGGAADLNWAGGKGGSS
jgi:hypothetical protein